MKKFANWALEHTLSQFLAIISKLMLKTVTFIWLVLYYVFGILKLGITFNRKADIANDVIKYINCNFFKSKTDWKFIEDYVFIPIRVVIRHLL